MKGVVRLQGVTGDFAYEGEWPPPQVLITIACTSPAMTDAVRLGIFAEEDVDLAIEGANSVWRVVRDAVDLHMETWQRKAASVLTDKELEVAPNMIRGAFYILKESTEVKGDG